MPRYEFVCTQNPTHTNTVTRKVEGRDDPLKCVRCFNVPHGKLVPMKRRLVSSGVGIRIENKDW